MQQCEAAVFIMAGSFSLLRLKANPATKHLNLLEVKGKGSISDSSIRCFIDDGFLVELGLNLLKESPSQPAALPRAAGRH